MPDSSNLHNVTRRGFLAAATTAALTAPVITWLERVPGGILAPTYAYADGSNFTIEVLSPKQVGLFVADVSADSNGNSVNTPVPGATLTLTSLYNKKSVTGITDEKGKVIFDISDLSPVNIDGTPLGDGYECNAIITMEAAGFRSFQTDRIHLKGGSGATVPTQPLTNLPYLAKVSFDGWDICYTTASFMCTYTNDETHTIGVSLGNTNSASSISLSVQAVDPSGAHAARVLGTMQTSANSALNCTDGSLSGTFLHEGTGKEIPAGWSLKIIATLDGTTYTFPTHLDCQNPPDETALAGTGAYNSALSAIPAFDTLGWGSLSFPGGVKVKLFEVNLPVQVNLNPWNCVLILVSTPSTGYTNDAANASESGAWKKNPWQGVKKNWDTQMDKWKKAIWQTYGINGAINKARASGAGRKNSVFQHMSLARKLDVSISGQAALNVCWKGQPNADVVTEAQFGGDLGLMVTLTEQALCGPVPVFIAFTFMIDVCFSLAADFIREKLVGLDNIEYKDFKFGLSIPLSLNVVVQLSAGVGLTGVASVGIVGAASITFFVGIGLVGTSDTKPNPHMAFSAAASVSVLIQLFMVKISVALYSGSWPNIWDNWKTTSSDQAVFVEADGPDCYKLHRSDGSLGYSLIAHKDRMAGLFGTNSAGDLWESALQLVTSSELATTVELQANALDNLEAGAIAPTVAMSDSGCVFALGGADEAPVQEYDYQYVGELSTQSCHLEGLGVHPLHADTFTIGHGVTPTTDVCINSNVYSNGRQKMVSYNEIAYLFRILTVAYPTVDGTVYRPRLAVARLEENGSWSSPHVLEYDSGLNDTSRLDVFDYDFDVVAHSANDSWGNTDAFRIVVTGGLLEKGDQTSALEACTEPTFALLGVNADLAVTSRSMFLANQYYSETTPGQFHLLANPCIVSCLQGSRGVPEGGACGFSFLHRSASNRADVMGENATVCFDSGVVVEVFKKLYVVQKSFTALPLAATTYEIRLMAGKGGTDNWYPYSILAYSATGSLDEPNGQVDAYTCTCSFTSTAASVEEAFAAVATTDSIGNIAGFTGNPFNLKCIHNAFTSNLSTSAKPWPGHNGVVFAQAGHLYSATFDPAQDASEQEFSISQIDIDGYDGADFSISASGNTLYFAKVREGDCGLDYDDEGNSSPRRDDLYQIYGARCLNDSQKPEGAFCKPYPIAKLAQRADSLVEANADDRFMSFLCGHVKDAANSRADLHYVVVPNVACVVATSFAPMDSFVVAGAGVLDNIPAADFDVLLSNEGNCAVRGFTVVMSDPSTGDEVNRMVVETIEPTRILLSQYESKSRRATYSRAEAAAEDDELLALADDRLSAEWITSDQFTALLESSDAYDAELGGYALTDSKKDGILLPGEQMHYRVSLNIPEDWSGSKEVTITIIDPIITASDAVSNTRFEETVASFHTLPGTVAPAITVEVLGAKIDTDLHPNDPVVEGRPAPATGDTMGSVASLALTAGIGALAAGIAAYEKRRSENQH